MLLGQCSAHLVLQFIPVIYITYVFYGLQNIRNLREVSQFRLWYIAEELFDTMASLVIVFLRLDGHLFFGIVVQ